MLYFSSINIFNTNCGIIEIGKFRKDKIDDSKYKELNKDQIQYEIENRIDSVIDGDGKEILSCYIIASLNDWQVEKGYHKELEKLGFKLLDSTLNSNSDNNIYIYGMKYYEEDEY